MNIDFRSAFSESSLRLGFDPELVRVMWKEIADAYSSPNRKYHNHGHLTAVLYELEKVHDEIAEWDLVVFATAFHDLVFRVIKSDNEEKSADKAVMYMQKAGLSEETRRRCRALIMATKFHESSPDKDAAFFSDADLSILGYNEFAYLNYCSQIRMEYRYFPDLIYNPGRKKVLDHFLKMKRIYQTDFFFSLYEKQARVNLENEWKQLSSVS